MGINGGTGGGKRSGREVQYNRGAGGRRGEKRRGGACITRRELEVKGGGAGRGRGASGTSGVGGWGGVGELSRVCV